MNASFADQFAAIVKNNATLNLYNEVNRTNKAKSRKHRKAVKPMVVECEEPEIFDGYRVEWVKHDTYMSKPIEEYYAQVCQKTGKIVRLLPVIEGVRPMGDDKYSIHHGRVYQPIANGRKFIVFELS